MTPRERIPKLLQDVREACSSWQETVEREGLQPAELRMAERFDAVLAVEEPVYVDAWDLPLNPEDVTDAGRARVRELVPVLLSGLRN